MENRVQLAVSNDPQEVTHIVLDSGVWLVSGQVNFLSFSTPAGTVFTAGNISVGELSFAPTETATTGIGFGGVCVPVAFPGVLPVSDCRSRVLITTADQITAHRKSDGRPDDLRRVESF